MKSQVQYIKIKLNLLIQPRCQISKWLCCKSKPCEYLRTASSTQMHNKLFSTRELLHESQKQQYNICLTFEDLLLLALQKVSDTLQMVLLFDTFLQLSFAGAIIHSVSIGQNAYKMNPRRYQKTYPNKSINVCNQSLGTLIRK